MASSYQSVCGPLLDETLPTCAHRPRLRVAYTSLEVAAVAQLGGVVRQYLTLFSSSSVSWLLPRSSLPPIFPFAQAIEREMVEAR